MMVRVHRPFAVLAAVVVCGLSVLLAVPAAAQPGGRVEPLPPGVDATPPSALPAPETLGEPEEKAAFIERHDDGEVNFTIEAADDMAEAYEVALLFDGIGEGVSLDAVEVCFQQRGGDSDMRFEVVVWAADGPGGEPGTELASFAAHATGVTGSPSFQSHPVDFTTPAGDIYLGVRMYPGINPDFALCGDNNGPSVQPGYTRANETGGWFDATGSPFGYTAFMIRGLFSTPGVVAENLYVPFFLVDTTSGGGTTTLFAVRNLLDSSLTVDLEVFTVDGASQATDSATLDPRETVTVNMRDVVGDEGLAVDPDGFARGWARLTTTGDPDGSPVMAGDYFQVDVANNFATGDLMPRDEDLCGKASVRFLDFGAGTRFGVLINNPRGPTPGVDPPSFTVQVLDEDGDPIGMPQQVHTDKNALELAASDFTGASFGTLVFDFGNAAGGYVFSEYSSEGRFSVGVDTQCEDP